MMWVKLSLQTKFRKVMHMMQVNIHEAKTRLSALIEGVSRGESFVIAKAGRPMARVIPYEASAKTRGGFMSADELQIPDDFDTMFQDEIIVMFCGEDEE